MSCLCKYVRLCMCACVRMCVRAHVYMVRHQMTGTFQASCSLPREKHSKHLDHSTHASLGSPETHTDSQHGLLGTEQTCQVTVHGTRAGGENLSALPCCPPAAHFISSRQSLAVFLFQCSISFPSPPGRSCHQYTLMTGTAIFRTKWIDTT